MSTTFLTRVQFYPVKLRKKKITTQMLETSLNRLRKKQIVGQVTTSHIISLFVSSIPIVPLKH